MVRVKWKTVLIGVDEALKFFTSQNVKPTLRTLFYNLYSKGHIPNTSGSYQVLSRTLVKARKEGRYPWDFMEDKTRVSYGSLEDHRFKENTVENFKDELQEELESLDLEDLINSYFDVFLPSIFADRWADQPQVCELWIEKEALASTLLNWTKEYGVTIRVNRGYSSWTFIYDNVKALRRILKKHGKVTVFYFGDLDPSGVDIDRFLSEALVSFGMETSQVELKRLALTTHQVEKYDLPPRPEDAETLAKIQRDPRTKKYDKPYIVELDALVAYVPNEFKNEIIEAITSLHDQDLKDTLDAEAETLQGEAQRILDDFKQKAIDELTN